MTIVCPEGRPSLAEAAERLNMSIERLDSEFGVVLISPERHTYAVRVKDSTGSNNFDPGLGPYADPKIAPMGGKKP